MAYFRTCLGRVFRMAVLMAMLFGAGGMTPVTAAPLHDSQPSLVLSGFGSDRGYYCTGDKITYHGFVFYEIDRGWFEPNQQYNLRGATVLVNGWPKATTNSEGRATWRETAGEPGDVEFTVTASKEGFTDSGPATISYTVMECTYNLKIVYDETYTSPDIGNGGTFTELAAVRVDGQLVPTKGRKLTSAGGGNSLEGTFVMVGVFSLGMDVFSCTPKGLSSKGNPFTITFDGTVGEDGSVTLDMQQAPISLSAAVEWACTKDPNDRIPKMLSMAYPSINLLKRAGITTKSFPHGSGSFPITVPAGVFWPISEMTGEGSISLTLVRPVSPIP